MFRFARLPLITSRYAAAALCLALFPPVAANAADSAIEVIAPWARATPAGARNGAAYLTLKNHDQTTRTLIAVSSAAAGMAEVHTISTTTDGMVTMRAAGAVEIPSGGELVLEPGGYHLMLMALKRPLVEGEHFAATLRFANGEEVEVQVPVRGIAAMDAGHVMSDMGGHQMTGHDAGGQKK